MSRPTRIELLIGITLLALGLWLLLWGTIAGLAR